MRRCHASTPKSCGRKRLDSFRRSMRESGHSPRRRRRQSDPTRTYWPARETDLIWPSTGATVGCDKQPKSTLREGWRQSSLATWLVTTSSRSRPREAAHRHTVNSVPVRRDILLRSELRCRLGAEGSQIDDYFVKNHTDHVLGTFKTQQEAIDWAKKQGHAPLVARVRHLNDKKTPY